MPSPAGRAAGTIDVVWLLASIGLAATLLMGSDSLRQPDLAAPPCSAPEYRAFDFWIGRWTVKQPDGQIAGTNVITREHGGCVLFESWTGASGMTGRSINVYDPVVKRWHQTWADSNGTLITLDGGWRDGAMRLEGETHAPQGRQRSRITWTPLPDGRVRQLWENSADAGRTWRIAFDGYYERATVSKPPALGR